MRIVGVVPGASSSARRICTRIIFVVNGYRSASPPAATPIGILSSDGSVIRRRSRSATHSSSAAARASIPIIFRSWNTRPDPASPCSASASVCR